MPVSPNRRGQQLADAVADLEHCETRLKRAFTRWEKARRKVRRLDKATAVAFEFASVCRWCGKSTCFAGNECDSNPGRGA